MRNRTFLLAAALLCASCWSPRDTILGREDGGAVVSGGADLDGGTVDAGPSEGDAGAAEVDAGPPVDGGLCGVGAPYLSPADLAGLPRADRSADILALEATPGALFAPQAVYTRLAGELQAARAGYPWVQPIEAVADFPPDILAGFDGGARRAVAADGGYRAWDCLNSMYGGTVSSVGDLIAVVSFAPVLDMMQLYETYSRLPPPLEWAGPNAYGGGWSDICLSAEPQGDVFRVYVPFSSEKVEADRSVERARGTGWRRRT